MVNKIEPKKRGRPKKVIAEIVLYNSPKDIIANTLHDWCSIPGCGIRLHYQETDDIIAKLNAAGFSIIESYGDE